MSNLKIAVVGPDAAITVASAGVQAMMTAGDTVIVLETDADVVIGSNCIRTYPSTTAYLKTLLKNVRLEKVKAKEPVKDTPKKAKKNVPVKKKKKTPDFIEGPISATGPPVTAYQDLTAALTDANISDAVPISIPDKIEEY